MAKSNGGGPAREVTKLLRLVRKTEGWRVANGGQHYRVYPPDAEKAIVVISRTPADSHALKNIRRDLQRAGLAL